MLIFDFIRLNIVPSDDGAYLFSTICFEFEGEKLGDFNQLVLVGTLILSLSDLLDRVENNRVILADWADAPKFFDLYSDDLNKSAIPVFTESFDGDAGLLFKINGDDFLVIKKWGKDNLLYIKMKHETYINAINSCLSYLKKINNHNAK